jgi:hypothetical protein
LGIKGRQSQRGKGEKDKLPRDKRLAVNITQQDYLLITRTAQKLKVSKAEIIITLIRKHLSKFAENQAKRETES